jgi:hypothetical protein
MLAIVGYWLWLPLIAIVLGHFWRNPFSID